MEAKVSDKASLIRQLAAHSPEIKGFGVEKLRIFGSFVKNTNIRGDSDVDLLVDFEPDKKTFDNFVELSFFLENLLGRKIELVTPQSLSKHIGAHILKEAEGVSL